MTQNNPFIDAIQSACNKFSSFDFNCAVSACRSNLEGIASANQAIAEGAQEFAKLQLKIAQENTEAALNLLKDVASSKDPKEAAAKQADSVKAAAKKAACDAKELSEAASKAGTKACDIIGKQVSANMQELNKSSSCCSSSSKKSSKAA